MFLRIWLSFNTQPPEGGWANLPATPPEVDQVSTHSRPKAAGVETTGGLRAKSFQHTAARRRLAVETTGGLRAKSFQHTAARRRLVKYYL